MRFTSHSDLLRNRGVLTAPLTTKPLAYNNFSEEYQSSMPRSRLPSVNGICYLLGQSGHIHLSRKPCTVPQRPSSRIPLPTLSIRIQHGLSTERRNFGGEPPRGSVAFEELCFF
jgi:hypothetical protein